MTTLNGKALRSIGELKVEGVSIVTNQPITLLGFVDTKTGIIMEKGHELEGQSISDKVFIFPKGVGSTVGPYVLLNLKKNNKAPLAIINRESDQGTIAGCSMAKIPLVYDLSEDPIDTIPSLRLVKVNISNGQANVEY